MRRSTLIVALTALLTISCVVARPVPGAKLQVRVTKENYACTDKTQHGDDIVVHYTGSLQSNGKVFDSSEGRGPFKFNLGGGKVIRGWDEGLVGMCVGEKRELIIPPHMAYGDSDVGGGIIPGGSTLVFQVELLAIERASAFDVLYDIQTYTTYLPIVALVLLVVFFVWKAAAIDNTPKGGKKPLKKKK